MSTVVKRMVAFLLSLLTLAAWIGAATPCAHAKEVHHSISGKYYVFSEKTDYTFSDTDSVISSVDSGFGILTVSGSYALDGSKLTVNEGVLSISYDVAPSKLSADPSQWHVIDDSGKQVDTFRLDEKIKSGAVILQTSLDGENWTDDTTLTDVFTPDSVLSKPFYMTKDVQQENGCYYRIVVAYKLERITGSHKTAFKNVKEKEIKRVAEVYTFHVASKDAANAISAMDVPRKEIGTKVEVAKNKGFSGNVTIDRNDPHFGWDLGVFTINGYTRETKDDKGNPVFLKNLGDKVALWFTLKQDIDHLNQNKALSIANDTDAYDQHFEIECTNFGQGALIIQYTDYQGVKHDPILYTNYLAANAKTGADTKVQLFEEGDYEVSLNYSIRNNPRQISVISVLPTYTDYKITFRFSIRNGNCMVFPFDSKTNTELADKAITANGFRLDMAKSRYLTIDVERQTIKINADGTVKTDTRFNRPAKDNETYNDEGIYIFTVKNLYTGGAPTKKTVYVGTTPYLTALSKTGLSASELNAKILDGYTVNDDGTLLEPAIPETIAPTEAVLEPSTLPVETQTPIQEQVVSILAPTASDTTAPAEAELATPISTEPQSEEPKSPAPVILFTLITVFIVIGGFLAFKKSGGIFGTSKEDRTK